MHAPVANRIADPPRLLLEASSALNVESVKGTSSDATKTLRVHAAWDWLGVVREERQIASAAQTESREQKPAAIRALSAPQQISDLFPTVQQEDTKSGREEGAVDQATVTGNNDSVTQATDLQLPDLAASGRDATLEDVQVPESGPKEVQQPNPQSPKGLQATVAPGWGQLRSVGEIMQHAAEAAPVKAYRKVSPPPVTIRSSQPPQDLAPVTLPCPPSQQESSPLPPPPVVRSVQIDPERLRCVVASSKPIYDGQAPSGLFIKLPADARDSATVVKPATPASPSGDKPSPVLKFYVESSNRSNPQPGFTIVKLTGTVRSAMLRVRPADQGALVDEVPNLDSLRALRLDSLARRDVDGCRAQDDLHQMGSYILYEEDLRALQEVHSARYNA